MRAKIILLLTILLFSFTNTQAQEKVKEDTKFKTWWVKTFDPKGKIKSPKKIDKTPKKELIRQRDSLILVIDSLSRNLDMVYAEKEELVEEVLTSDSINDGKFLGSLYNGYIEDAGNGDTDSLINLWYEHKTLSFADTSFSAIDDCDFQSNIPDSVYLNRLAKMNSFISVPYNRQIRNYIIAYTVKNKITLERVLGIAPYYMPQFEEIFDKFDLPIELTAMAIIESALNPVAVSRARAKGMWQFMYSTGKMYNLTINSYVDERFDPIESAYAAAKYLKDSYKIYGDWALAISSYNCGIGNVNKAIRRSGGSKEFWKIYPYLPRETRGYLPSFVAALYTLNYYKEHNLTPLAVSFPKNIDTIKVNKMLHLEQVCHFTGIGLKELKDLNPQ